MWINEARREIWENSAYEGDGDGRVITMRAEERKLNQRE